MLTKDIIFKNYNLKKKKEYQNQKRFNFIFR